MKTLQRFWMLLGVLSVLAFAGPAFSQSPYWAVDEDQAICLVGGYRVDGVGDDWYQSWWMGNQPWVNFLWSAYDFDVGDWDNGFGYENVDDCNRPLCRTFNGLLLLYGSDPNPVTRTDDYSGNFLHWAGNYAASNIDELDARCPHPPASAMTKHTVPCCKDDWTQLYPGFFYDLWVVERAAALTHEARHAEGVFHDAYDWECGQGGSCDTSWGYQGANVFEIAYEWWYWYAGVYAPAGQKARAKASANYALANAFRDRPPYILTCGSPEEPC